MLKALLHGKSRLGRDPDEPWTALDEYRDREDPLTSFVFGTLLYLPADWLWRILRMAAATQGANALPAAVGELAPPEFWPTWWLTNASGSRQRVEPDVFLPYEACDVIVEAKRRDGQRMQKPEQLARELAAYFQTRGTGKPIYLLAVGGLLTTDPEATEQLRRDVAAELAALLGPMPALALSARIEAVPWGRMLRAIRALLGTEAPSRQHRAILEDVEEAFRLHHVVDWQMTWLSELARSIADHHLEPTTWTGLAWRAAAPPHRAREQTSARWWREGAAYRRSDDHAQRVLERLTGGRA